MTTTKKHYVEFLSPGTFVSESSSREIDSWDIASAVLLSKEIDERHGAKPYGFRFTTRIEHSPIDDGEGGTLKVQPKEIDRSGIYYLGGTLYTYDEVVARNDPKEDILRSNMLCNDMWVIIENTNSWKFTNKFRNSDKIVDSLGRVIRAGSDPDLVEYTNLKKAEKLKEHGM